MVCTCAHKANWNIDNLSFEYTQSLTTVVKMVGKSVAKKEEMHKSSLEDKVVLWNKHLLKFLLLTDLLMWILWRNHIKSKGIVERDARYTVRDKARGWHLTLKSSLQSEEYLECSYDVCQISARWGPLLLTHVQKKQWVKIAKQFLKKKFQYVMKRNIITGDETLVH